MTKQKTIINDLTEGPLLGKLIRFSLPFMLANILQAFYTMADLAIVGQFVGSAGLSGTSIGGEISMILMTVGIGLASGGQIVIAQLVGMKEYGSMKKTIGTLLTLLFTASVILGVLGIACSKLFLRLMNTPEASMESAHAYLVICCCGMPFIYIYNSLCSLLRGMGDSKRPLIFVAISASCNIVLDLLFVAVFSMGAAGAAIATIISQALSAGLSVGYLYRHKEQFYFDFKPESFKPDLAQTRLILRLGIPVVLQYVVVSLSMMYITAQINTYGVAAAAVNGAGSKFGTIASVISSAMQTAISTVVGQNVGAGKPERASRSVWVGWGVCLVVWVAIAFVCFFFPKELFSIFNREEEVLELSVGFLKIMAFMYLTFALMAPPSGLVLGTGATTFMMIISLLDGVVMRLGLALLFTRVFGMGMEGYWWGNALAGFTVVIGSTAYLFAGKWKTKRLIEE